MLFPVKKYLAQIVVVLLSLAVMVLTVSLPSRINYKSSVTPFNNLEGASTNALSSSWYCFNFNGVYTQNIQTDLLLTSFNLHPVTGSYVFYPASGQPHVTSFSLGPRSFNVTNVNALNKTPTVAVAVNINGGGVAVEMKIQSGSFSNVIGCDPEISNFGVSSGGSTNYGNKCEVAILNPTAQPAVIDIQVFTSSGVLFPTQLQGLVVGSDSVGIEDLSQLVPNQNIKFIRAFTPSGASDIIMSTISFSTDYLLYQPAFYQNLNRVTFATSVNSGNQVLTFINPTQNTVKVKVTPILQGLDSSPIVETIPAQNSINVSLSQLTQIPAGADYGLSLDLRSDVFAWIYLPSQSVLQYPYPDLSSSYALPVLDNVSLNGQLSLDSARRGSRSIKLTALFPFNSYISLYPYVHFDGTLVTTPMLSQLLSATGNPIDAKIPLPLAFILTAPAGVVPDLLTGGSGNLQILPVQIGL